MARHQCGSTCTFAEGYDWMDLSVLIDFFACSLHEGGVFAETSIFQSRTH